MAIPHRRTQVRYRESDGKPMAETPVHRDELLRVLTTLQAAYADRPDVYVSGNMMFYYEEGNPRASVSPDVFVVFGVPKLPERRVFKLWEEAAPAVVFEITSPSTRRVDFGKKHTLYAGMGVREYFLYDPLGEYLQPALQGYRLDGDGYAPIAPAADGALLSETLNMLLRPVDGRLRLFDRQTGAELFSPAERAEAAERRVAELEALLRQRQAEQQNGAQHDARD
jgi:Uma2 family endonuclease